MKEQLRSILVAMKQPGGNIVGGINISRWATDPKHEETVSRVYDSIKTNLSKYSTSPYHLESIIDDMIQSNPIVKKMGGSKVTGKMILDGAKKYGVDPALVMAIAQVDSHYGTVGKGSFTKNPGNIGNDDTGKLKYYYSWEEGIEGISKLLNVYRNKYIEPSNYVEKSSTTPALEVQKEIVPINFSQKVEEQKEETSNPLSMKEYINSLANVQITKKPKEEPKFNDLLNKSKSSTNGFVSVDFLQSGGFLNPITPRVSTQLTQLTSKNPGLFKSQSITNLSPMYKFTTDQLNKLKDLNNYYKFLNKEQNMLDTYQEATKETLPSDPLRDVVNSPQQQSPGLPFNMDKFNTKRKKAKLF